LSIISAASSGGVFSRVDFIASIIEETGSFSASLISAEDTVMILGSPLIRSLPFMSFVLSSSSGKQWH
jgi:hypothetical protein